MDFKAARDILTNPKNVTFKDLLKICEEFFGTPRINGSHHVFRVPWQGKPWVNIQADKKMAKPYQVKDVIEALNKLEKIKEEQKPMEAKNERPSSKPSKKV